MKVIDLAKIMDESAMPGQDGLGHNHYASRILKASVLLPPGSVIAVQGAWGRGKTDVIHRAAYATHHRTWSEEVKCPDEIACGAFWINPWQYGNNDLLTPLVKQMAAELSKMGDKEKPDKGFTKEVFVALGGLLGAGLSMGIKGAGIPTDVLESPMVMKLFEILFNAKGEEVDKARKEAAEELKQGDPIEKISTYFETLVRKLAGDDKRILVFVDDLDRCLPHRQVAILEAIHFMTATNAPVCFMLAMDPVLAEQAVMIHYNTDKLDKLDPRLYMDKIISLRINLPSIDNRSVEELIKVDLAQNNLPRSLREHNLDPDVLSLRISAVIGVQALRNPRLLDRLFAFIALYLSTLSPGDHIDHTEFSDLIRYVALCERWPAVRLALQDAGNDKPRFEAILGSIFAHIREEGIVKDALVRRLPTRGADPVLCHFMESYYSPERHSAESLLIIEKKIQKVGM